MKTYAFLFGILAVAAFIGGLYGETPMGEPAVHLLWLSGVCSFLVLLFTVEHFKTKGKGEKGN